MLVFHSPQSRLAHLLGFHRLVEARIEKGLGWSRGRVLLEHHIHSLCVNSLFQSTTVLANKSIDSIDNLLAVLNSEERPLGNEIVGVPEDLTRAVYKLSFLNKQDTEVSPWAFELSVITALLRDWRPSVDMSVSSAPSLLLLAQLYHLACLCLMQYLWNPSEAGVDPGINSHVSAASVLIENSDLTLKPMNSAAWPLTVLAIFAQGACHQQTLEKPLISLTNFAHLQGYRSVLQFLTRVWDGELGAAVLRRPEILAIVHI